MPVRRSCRTPSSSSSSARNGCRECQHRRIKHTKEHHCRSQGLSHSITCQYISMSSSRAWSKTMSYPATSTTETMAPTSHDDRSMSHPLSHLTTVEGGDLNIPDLGLMVQWCTETYRSVSRNTAVEWIWHATIPREAMHHPFLMHAILALSSLHLAFTTPPGIVNGDLKTNYLRTAHAHRQQALLEQTKVIHKLDAANSNAAFAVSSLLIVFSFAMPLSSPTIKSATDPIDEVCHIFQGTQRSTHVFAEIIDWVSRGELRPLVMCDSSFPKMPDTSRLAIMALSRMNTTLTERDSGHETDIFDRTIGSLGHSLDSLARGGELMITAFQWIIQIPPRFIDLLRERHPFALVILAHYAVILHALRRHWWVGDWGDRLIRAIGHHLDAGWKRSISWVIDATGCFIAPG
ncbi:hypothetical protein FE257_001385 [Aspergillus nanangensis]|uniref:Zn(II)2Cys6 transcription factor n=1 Tax=Aspergillus nanangensis TaxID=2582783 RepID=A0AAD4CE60_ASPNN|nr:hypothetical protein FE257_001385 [Aspergillus nanangensis]